MSTNGLNITDNGEMVEGEGEKVVTMMDVLQEQQDFEDDANAVLGASDEKNCTYSKGYIKRQAIYACLTCCSEAKTDPDKRAGVCLACSLNCHENHELIELYTKRNFRCDCGNPKFNHPCQFTADKIELNIENSYNQNFSGVYCVCSRPYPDPEATFEDEMIQCIVCEDWLHASHLEATVPGNDQYSEMICKKCMEKNDFLHDYSELVVNIEDNEIEVIIDGAATLPNGYDNEKLGNGVTETINDIPTDIEMKEDGEQLKNLDVILNDNGSEVENNETNKKFENNDNETSDAIDNNENIDSTNFENKNIIENDSKTIDSEKIGIVKNIGTEDSIISMETEQNGSEKREANTYVDENPNNEGDIEISEPIKEITEPKDAPATELSDNNKTDLVNTNVLDEPSAPEHPKLAEVEDMDDQTETKIDEATKTETTNDKNTDLETENKDNIKEAETHEIPLENTDLDLSTKDDEEKQETKDIPAEQDNKEIEGDTLEKATEELSKLASDDNETEDNSKTDLKIENFDTSKENNDIAKTETNDDSTNETTFSSDNKDSTIPIDLQESTEQPDIKRKLEETPEKTAKKPKLDTCTRPKSKKIFKGATFWPASFRQRLCTCSECLTMYKDLSVMFLIDPEDTVTAYEALGKERIDGSPASQYEKGLEALSSLDRVQQINALTEYNKMRDKLLDFLKSFKDRKEIVKEEDIRAFFAGMKPKREPDGVYFCR